MARVASPRQIAEAQARNSGFRGENLDQSQEMVLMVLVEPEYKGGEDAEDKLDGRDQDWGQRGVQARSSFLLDRDAQ